MLSGQLIIILKQGMLKCRIFDKNGTEVKGKMVIISENRVNFTADEQVDGHG